MAVDADPVEQLSTSADVQAVDAVGDDLDRMDDPAAGQDESAALAVRSRWRSPIRLALVGGTATAIGLAALVGWLAYDGHRHQVATEQRNLFIEVAKQGAINLTTISHTEVDKDVQRILDSSTGTFHDDFQKRSKPFTDVVKQIKSTSTGTVSDAGLESLDGNQAEVLVAVAVKTSTAAAADPELRHWRMRISVQRNGADAKVSNVEFVP